MNDPTPEQIEAAAKALWEVEDSQVLDPVWASLSEIRHRHYRTTARVLLVAAAGVTPQAPEEPHDCSWIAMIAEVESLKRLLDTQTQRGDFWERRHKEAVQVDDAKLAEVTRVTLVGRAGERSAEHWDYAGVELSVQDDGRTLKVFPLRGDDR